MGAAAAGSGGRLERYRRLYFEADSTERTVFFSDAVFAIAMTLLVLEIQIPDPEELGEGQSLARVLAEHWYQFFGYTLSFYFIGSVWLSHHRVWRLIKRVDPTVQGVNLLMLFFIALIPVPTAIIAAYGPTTAAAPAFYAASIAGVGLSLLGVLAVARRRGLMDEAVEPEMYTMVRRQLMVSPLVFLGSCVIALLWGPLFRAAGLPGVGAVGPLVAMLSWSLLWPIFRISNHQMRRYLRAADGRDLATTAGSAPAAATSEGAGSD